MPPELSLRLYMLLKFNNNIIQYAVHNRNGEHCLPHIQVLYWSRNAMPAIAGARLAETIVAVAALGIWSTGRIIL